MANLDRKMTVMLLLHEITIRLIEGETVINIRVSDERTAIGFEAGLRKHLRSLGLAEKWPRLKVSLGPETVVVSTRGRVGTGCS